MDALTESVRDAYARFFVDPEAVWEHLSPDVVFHVAGDHPLSGDHVGLEAVRRYVDTVTSASNGRAGFSVTSAFTDESGALLLVEGTAFHGDEPFVRTIVHLIRLEDGLVVEFWDNPFDQRAEDQYWSARVPAQRATTPAADRGAGGGIPSQLMRACGHS
jgi:ketosteroid isomerase-like protein